MTGTILYPLNELRDFDVNLYELHAQKYSGREHLMQERIPTLQNCLWNDVLFLTAVHPVDFRKAFESKGFVRERPFRAFEFEVGELNHTRMTVITHMQINQPAMYEPFEMVRLHEYARIPQETLDYWQERNEKGDTRPFLYLHIPHILYQGTLDISTASVVLG
jgi:hypothetical protein